MFSGITAKSSIRHTPTADALSALGNPSVSQIPSTSVKTRTLSANTLQAIQKIADGSIQNKKKIDDLVRSIELAAMKIQALKEESNLQDQSNKNANPLKPILRETIALLTEAEKNSKGKIFTLSKEIQLLEKEQQKKIKEQQKKVELEKERKANFKKHFSDYKEFFNGKNNLEARKSFLHEKQLVLQNDRKEKNNNIDNLSRTLKSLNDSIKKSLGEKVSEIYEEMMQDASLFKQHGAQLTPESTMNELIDYLRKMTVQTRPLKPAEKKIIELRDMTYGVVKSAIVGAASGAVVAIFMKSMYSFINESKQLAQRIKATENPNEIAFLEKQYAKTKFDAAAAFGLFLLLSSIIACYSFFIGKMRNNLIQDETDELSKNNPLQRTLKKEFIASSQQQNEALFKFAFGFADLVNMKLFKKPFEAMKEEITQLISDARNDGKTSIGEHALYKEKIRKHLDEFKNGLKEKRDELEKELNAEINKFIVQKRKYGELLSIDEPRDLFKKADFVKKYMTSEQTKVARNKSDKAVFIDEFLQIFSGKNEDDLKDTFGNMFIDISQKILDQLSSTNENPIEQRIKNAERNKQELKQPLEQANAELARIDQENRKLEDDIQHVTEEIQEQESGMAASKKGIMEFRFSERQWKKYDPQLRDVGIHIMPDHETEKLSDKKIEHAETKQREIEERLASLLKEHNDLYKEYSIIQGRKKQNEDQLEKIEFIEKMDKADKEAQIKKIKIAINKYQQEIEKLASEENDLVNKLDEIHPLKDILTLKAIRRAKNQHLEQSDKKLKNHAVAKGYSSNYRSVGHFLQACLDTHAALQKNIEETGVPELTNFFVKSDMDVADGMDNKSFQIVPISASVSDFTKEETRHGEKQYRIDHIYGYVPREQRIAK